MSAKSKPRGAHVAPLRRTGLQRVSCLRGCDTTAYLTVGQIERGRIPFCVCGERLIPDHPDLAAEVLEPEQWHMHPWLGEYQRQRASIDHGQASHVQRGANVRDRDELAADRVVDLMRAESRARQLSGLAQNQRTPEPMPF